MRAEGVVVFCFFLCLLVVFVAACHCCVLFVFWPSGVLMIGVTRNGHINCAFPLAIQSYLFRVELSFFVWLPNVTSASDLLKCPPPPTQGSLLWTREPSPFVFTVCLPVILRSRTPSRESSAWTRRRRSSSWPRGTSRRERRCERSQRPAQPRVRVDAPCPVVCLSAGPIVVPAFTFLSFGGGNASVSFRVALETSDGAGADGSKQP